MLKKTDLLFYKESCSLAFVIAAGLSLIVITIKLTSFSELIFASSHILSSILLIFFYLLPSILTTVFPIAIFTACALVSIRMHTDKEIEALFASGMSMTQLLKPTITIGVVSVFLMLANTFYYEPYAQNQFRFFRWYQAQQIVESFFQNNIKEKTFISNIPFFNQSSFVFYTQSIHDQKMSDIFMALKNNDFITDDIVISQSGQFFKTASRGYPDFQLELNDATIYSNLASTTHFKKMNISLLNAFGSKIKPKEKFEAEKFQFTEQTVAKPFSMAMCVLFFPALGFCLGIQRSNKQVWRIYLGIALIVGFFYSIFALANVVMNHTILPRLFVFSIPPILFGLLTLFTVIEKRKLK